VGEKEPKELAKAPEKPKDKTNSLLKDMLMRSIILIFLALIPSVMYADGTIYLSDIEPLLKQQPELWTSITNSFDLRDVGVAPRINVRESQKLDGYRIAPYTIEAKRKGSTGPFIFEIEIQAKTRYYDSKGKEVSVQRAAKLKEDFEGVAIQMRPQADIDAEAEFLRNPNKN